MDAPPLPIVTQQISIVDTQGHPRILLSAKDDVPTIILLRADGTPAMTARTDAADHPAITLANPVVGGPVASLEIDDKGAHIKFDRPGGASAYLYLNNSGGSGVVLIDVSGRRRFDAQLAADGTSKIERFTIDGKALP